MKKNILLLFCLTSLITFSQNPTPVSGVNMLKNSRWPISASGKTIINVSWENPSSYDQEQRQWVKESIEETWGKYANIEFVGWDKSTPTSKGIRIKIDDFDWPHAKDLGYRLDGVPNGLVLNFKFLGKFKCNLNQEHCIKFIAVHEFGHALGLAHEHNRKDCLCGEEPQGRDGDFYVTPCDLYSIMNYCNPRWNNYGKLSDLDIVGIQIIYGKPNNSNVKLYLNEIKLIPTSKIMIDRLETIRNIIYDSEMFEVNDFTQEDNDVPLKAVINLPNLITIRYFHVNDSLKAINLKKLLVVKGYNDNDIVVENMINKMAKPIPNYIEIWSKEELKKGINYLDEIRYVPCNNSKELSISIKQLINDSNLFRLKLSTQEENQVPKSAIDRLAKSITIRYFHPDDEIKANEIKKILFSTGNHTDVIVENMLPKMSMTYPNYIEIWTK